VTPTLISQHFVSLNEGSQWHRLLVLLHDSVSGPVEESTKRVIEAGKEKISNILPIRQLPEQDYAAHVDATIAEGKEDEKKEIAKKMMDDLKSAVGEEQVEVKELAEIMAKYWEDVNTRRTAKGDASLRQVKDAATQTFKVLAEEIAKQNLQTLLTYLNEENDIWKVAGATYMSFTSPIAKAEGEPKLYSAKLVGDCKVEQEKAKIYLAIMSGCQDISRKTLSKSAFIAKIRNKGVKWTDIPMFVQQAFTEP